MPTPEPTDTAVSEDDIAPAPTVAAASDRVWRGTMAAILGLYAVIQIFWITATPLQRITLPDNLPQGFPSADSSQTLLVGTGPDEKEHFVYIVSLAERGQIPKPSPEYRTSPEQFVSYQAQHPPLFYALGALLYRALPATAREDALWYALRTLGALFGAVVILFAGRAARLAFPDRPLVSLGTPAVMAFLPMFGHMMGCLSNEPMAMALTAILWWRVVRVLRGSAPVTIRDGVWLGLLLGLAVETRMTALLWLPGVILALWFAGRRGGGLAALGIFCAVFAILVAPWLIHNQASYGAAFFRTFDRPTLTPGTTLADFWTGHIPPRKDHPVSLNPRYTILYFTSTSWTPYWLIKYFLPAPPGFEAQILWQILFVLLDAGSMIALVMHSLYVREKNLPADPAGRTILQAAALAVAVCVFAAFEQMLYADWTVVLSPGRYIIASVAASALLFTFSLSTLGERRARPARSGPGRFIAPLVLGVILFAFDAYSVSLVRHFYKLVPPQPSVQPVPKTTESETDGT